jgi:hypothetical protein
MKHAIVGDVMPLGGRQIQSAAVGGGNIKIGAVHLPALIISLAKGGLAPARQIHFAVIHIMETKIAIGKSDVGMLIHAAALLLVLVVAVMKCVLSPQQQSPLARQGVLLNQAIVSPTQPILIQLVQGLHAFIVKIFQLPALPVLIPRHTANATTVLRVV